MFTLRSIGSVALFALRPIPGAINAWLNMGAGIAGLVFLTLLGSAIGADGQEGTPPANGQDGLQLEVWPWGAFALALGIGVLCFIAAVRIERQRLLREVVAFDFEVVAPEEGLQDEWVQQIRVTNLGPGSAFRAVVESDVDGLDGSAYGRGTVLAWEQTFDKDNKLGRRQTGTIRMAVLIPNPHGPGVCLRFWIPPSPYNPQTYGVGATQTAPSGTFHFELQVRDVERDVYRATTVRVNCDSHARPSTQLIPVGPA